MTKKEITLRFILFVIIVAAIFYYVSWKWEEFNRQTEEIVAEIPVIAEVPVFTMEKEPKKDFFLDTRWERERVYSRQVELLKEIISDKNADSEVRKEAQNELVKLTRKMGQEAEIEGLIRAKGYTDAIVYLFDQSAIILVKQPDIDASDVARIAELVGHVTTLQANQLSIIPKP